ncbi:hypothetical protein EVAR_57208_1 [Eumeta japonica]|uniref:Uncharacterized protein n=1 Tax=Eumeta variegata TaxID=151549 RepID=A0A4C1YK85_EUMVA|nr:hypothetical protein EVAR_57208_1 [Eumeta japonica]
MTGLRCAIQKILPKKHVEDTELEENHNESLCRTLKRTEDAYDDLCNCCSTYNEVFGFSDLELGKVSKRSLNRLGFRMSFREDTFCMINYYLTVQLLSRDAVEFKYCPVFRNMR